MRILIVDDSRQIVELFKEILCAEGYAVDTAYSGEEGEKLARLILYDLTLLDVVLPKKDGFQVCREVRTMGIKTPIVFISGKMKDDPDIERGLDCGGDDYLLKPITPTMLLARVRAFLRKDQNNRNIQIQIGDFIIVTVYRQVRKENREIILTRKEYAMLEYLAYHPKMIVTRTELEEHCWDMELDASSNIVDQHIKNLRKKLGDDDLIETVKGMGYRLKSTKEDAH